MIVLDTNVLIWLTTKEENLSRKASQYIKKSTKEGGNCISSFSVWEVALLIMKKRLNITIGFDLWLENVKNMSSITIIPVDVDIAVKSVNLEWDHKDPADRIIVATALELRCPLITSDEKIRNFPDIQTIW